MTDKPGFFARLAFRINHPDGIFYDEKIIGDTPYAEPPLPVRKPPHEMPWHLRPIKFNVKD